MKIGGFQPLTLCDFPYISAAIVFTQGCNYRCPFCHNGSLLNMQVPEIQLLDAGNILDTLKTRKTILDGLVISGGEPTIQEMLLPFIKQVRNIGYKIKLDTNGSHPDVIAKLLSENVLDYIAMDIKAPMEKYNLLSSVEVNIEDILHSIEIIKSAEITSEFRTTYIPDLLTERDIESIRSLIPSNIKYTIQEFIPENAWNWPVKQKYF